MACILLHVHVQGSAAVVRGSAVAALLLPLLGACGAANEVEPSAHSLAGDDQLNVLALISHSSRSVARGTLQQAKAPEQHIMHQCRMQASLAPALSPL